MPEVVAGRWAERPGEGRAGMSKLPVGDWALKDGDKGPGGRATRWTPGEETVADDLLRGGGCRTMSGAMASAAHEIGRFLLETHSCPSQSIDEHPPVLLPRGYTLALSSLNILDSIDSWAVRVLRVVAHLLLFNLIVYLHNSRALPKSVFFPVAMPCAFHPT
jgi:hypothetical protein